MAQAPEIITRLMQAEQNSSLNNQDIYGMSALIEGYIIKIFPC